MSTLFSSSPDPPKSDPQAPQALPPGNAPVPVMSVMPPHPPPPQLNVLHHPYPVPGGGRVAPPVTLQPAAPYAMTPQVPMHHLHPAVPLLQGPPGGGAQGLPPPPPPPPPMQQGMSQMTTTTTAHPDSHTIQVRNLKYPLTYMLQEGCFFFQAFLLMHSFQSLTKGLYSDLRVLARI